jgi:hypothetical protein
VQWNAKIGLFCDAHCFQLALYHSFHRQQQRQAEDAVLNTRTCCCGAPEAGRSQTHSQLATSCILIKVVGERGAMASYLLHGTLHVTIYQAENIINTERTTGGAPAFFRRV